MLLPRNHLQAALKLVLQQRIEQGGALDAPDWLRRIDAAAGSYDALFELALELREPPARADWSYVEPLTWDGIRAEAPSLDPGRPWPQPDFDAAAERVRAGFVASACGCMLGKPIEVDPTLAELQAAGERTGDWPLRDYIPVAFLDALGRRHDDWRQTVREHLDCVAADDDIHYTVIGMLLLEDAGPGFGRDDLARCWGLRLAPAWTWGAERTALLAGGLQRHHLLETGGDLPIYDPLLLNPGDESCGALIRADAYGYACPGNPDLAAWLAWKDASCTHIKTGVYGAMFVAALLALCHTAAAGRPGNARLDLVEEALRRVPSNTRFTAVLRDCLEQVSGAGDWLSGYHAVHRRYAGFTHCRVYQEIGTLINSLKFAESVDHGFCLQVSQGNDTDSFGATAGAMLGTLFGPGRLANRWVQPLNNRIELALAGFYEQKLDALADRLSRLPERVFRARTGEQENA